MADEKRYQAIISAPIGNIGVRLHDGRLSELTILDAQHTVSAEQPEQSEDASVDRVRRALQDYFRDPFSIAPPALELLGTPFQLRVWRALQQIPPGTTRCYGELARRLNTSPRAIGNACRQNPVPIFVPCHRVVAANGDGGFMGATGGWAVSVKRWLLAHEASH